VSEVKIAIYPGTFDPLTSGHLDILEEACALFDRVVAAVGINPSKTPLFSARERLEMLRESVQWRGLSNIETVAFEGLTVDCASRHQAGFIVRGLRAVTDFEHEFGLLLANEQLDASIKTVFVMPSHKYLYLSSSVVRQAASLGGRIISGSVPPPVEARLREKFNF